LRKFSLFVVAALLSCSLAACSTVNTGTARINAQPPKDEALRMEQKKDISCLVVSVELSAQELSDALNRTVPRELYRGAADSGGASAHVVRNGAIRITAADNYLHVAVPIALSFQYGILETPRLPTTLKFRISPKVTADWRVDPDLRFDGLGEQLPKEIKIGPISLAPRGTAERVAQPVQQKLSSLITGKLNEKFPLQREVSNLWERFQKPIRLDKRYNAWLVLTPQDLSLFPLYAQKNELKLSLGLTTLADVVVGPEPLVRQPQPLPRLKLGGVPDRKFRLSLNSELFYDDLLKIASPLLLNREIGQKGRSVILKGIALYGNGEHIIVKLETTGAVEGTFFLTGRPVLDPVTKRLSMQDVDFDLQSKSMLLQSADWFLHGSIRKTIEEKLNMDLTQRLAQATELASKSIAHVPLADGVFLSGTLNTVRINKVAVGKDRLAIGLYSEGETAIKLH
jgi:hypothetical protein